MLKIILLLFTLQISLIATEFSKCIHLLNRTSFGVNTKGLSNCLKDPSYDESVSRILNSLTILANHEKPEFAQTIIKPPKKLKDLNAAERMNFRKKRKASQIAMKEWWMHKLITTQTPFEEAMVLFWHNHFTSSLRKVGQSALMYRQNQLFRKYALGNFSDLLHAIIEDPAMLIYLDNRANRKKQPNENFARELLELFTLGEGNYTEQDVKALARGLTGYSIDKNMTFRFKKRIHDQKEKVFMGQSGNFNAHEIIDIILSQNATAIFIVEKLWKTFIGYTPDPQEVQRLAEIFRKSNYELKPLMKTMLTSPYFTRHSSKGNMIKSPIELIVGTLRSFEYEDFDPKTAIQYARRLGQNLLDPPNVKGWSGEETWINTNTLLIRKSFLNRLTRGDAMKHLKYNLFKSKITEDNIENRAAKTLLPVSVFITPSPKFNQTLRTILQHPLYQLK